MNWYGKCVPVGAHRLGSHDLVDTTGYVLLNGQTPQQLNQCSSKGAVVCFPSNCIPLHSERAPQAKSQRARRTVADWNGCVQFGNGFILPFFISSGG